MAKSALEVDYITPGNRRDMYRALPTDMVAKITGRPDVFPVRDISPRGLGLSGLMDVEIGDPLLLCLYQRGTMVAMDLIARVARKNKDITGLYFENLERRQVDAVHAIVLLIQKEQMNSEKLLPLFAH